MTTGPAAFPVIALRPEDACSDEVMGSKRKGWYRRPGLSRPWLFKFSRKSDGRVVGEHWSEKLAAEIAELIGVPHAQVELASLDGAPGSISERFPILEASNAELVHGNDLLADLGGGYDREQWHGQRDHTVANIRAAIARAIERTFIWGNLDDDQIEAAMHDESSTRAMAEWIEERRSAMQGICSQARAAAESHLAGLLILDAIILNTDRHHENWGIIRYVDDEGQRHVQLAPSFDHASSLARTVSETQAQEWLADRSIDRVAWYAGRAHGAIWLDPSSRHGPSPLALVQTLHQQDPAWFAPWLTRVRAVQPAQIADLAGRIPGDMIGPATRAFVIALVRHTITTLAALP